MEGLTAELWARWLVYLITLSLLAITPGPMNLLALYDGMAYGWRATQWAVIGGLCGILIILTLAFFGVGSLIREVGWLDQGLRIVGIGYIIYLGLKIAISKKQVVDLAPSIGEVHFSSKPRTRFKEMFLLALLSPGDLFFFGSFFPTLIDLNQSLVVQYLVFASTYVGLDYAIMSSHAVLGKFFLRWATPKRLKIFNAVAGFLLVCMAALLILINSGIGVGFLG